ATSARPPVLAKPTTSEAASRTWYWRALSGMRGMSSPLAAQNSSFPRSAWERAARRSASRLFRSALRRVCSGTQSVPPCVPTQSVGTRLDQPQVECIIDRAPQPPRQRSLLAVDLHLRPDARAHLPIEIDQGDIDEILLRL